MHTLYNDILQVQISSKGAELQSIFNKQNGLEYMWSGDPAFWGKKSPVLFPIVGGLKNNCYRYEGKEYTLSRHGFARDMNFELTDTSSAEQTGNSLTFSIASNEETLKNYPFHFRFSVQYTLRNNILDINFIVENTDEKELLFSVGAHPAFKVPLVDGTGYDDYYLLFNKTESAGRYPLSEGGLTQTTSEPVLANSDCLPLKKELFFNDALVFKYLQSDAISIASDKTKHGLKVSFLGFPYMGIWSAKGADFVCIEPWCGVADSVSATGDLSQKEGIEKLNPGDTFSRTYSIEVFEE